MVYIICFLTAFVSLQHNFSPLVSGSCMVKPWKTYVGWPLEWPGLLVT